MNKHLIEYYWQQMPMDTKVIVAKSKDQKIWNHANYFCYREDYEPTPHGVILTYNNPTAEITYWPCCEKVTGKSNE